jgi:hypothetical protein
MKHLIDLFENPEPWIIELENRAWYNDPPILGNDSAYHYIYCWVNLDTQWCYVGKHKSPFTDNRENYLGSCCNDHYWNSREIHPFKCIILSYESSIDDSLLLESMIIDQYMIDTYSGNGLYNKARGGKGGFTEEARRAGLEVRIRLGDGDCMKPARKVANELWPESHGTPPQFYESGHKRLLEIYPDTNGASPEWPKAGTRKLKRALS